MVIETDTTIFVVDDDALVRDSLKTLIMTTGLGIWKKITYPQGLRKGVIPKSWKNVSEMKK